MSPALPPSEPTSVIHGARVVVAGKYLQHDGGAPFFMRGVSYGPFRPNSRNEPFPEDGQLGADLRHISALGFNTVRIYDLPTVTMLREVEALGLRLIVGIPWAEHVDFLSDRGLKHEIQRRVRDAAARLRDHACIVALLVGNEIEKTLVRWMGPERVRDFVEKLICIARDEAPQLLISYATYPSTEYLVPRNSDFLAVNVYLESREAFTACLARLQNRAANKPLVITEFGIDVAARGAEMQVEAMRWQHDCLLRGGAAGGVWFAYTDEWHRGGREIMEWQFGIVDRERNERPASAAVRGLNAELSPPASPPRISVIVCTRNGSATLRACLASLVPLNYPDFEVLVIDDGSTDTTAEIAASFESVRYHRQDHAGLSVARNLGARLATGSILAYTDDDCVAHRDWLLHLSHAFAEQGVVAAGGPNIPPPPRNRTERIVALAPGAPVHVLLNDTEAEHLPGCNLAIRKDALERIGGFRAEFMVAGDDVDVCWRLRDNGGRLVYVPGAMVWHHRRVSVKAYLRQQTGYGNAEALLMKAHPVRFGPLGGARWRGGIYGDQVLADHPAEGSIFHGQFGLGAFQLIYASSPFRWWEQFTGVIWPALVVAALVARQWEAALLIVALAVLAAWQVSSRVLSCAGDRPLLWWLSLLQPIIREWARLRGMIRTGARPSTHPLLPEIVPPEKPHKIALNLGTLRFWSESGVTRDVWLHEMRKALKSAHILHRDDDGWRWFDIEMWPWAAVSRAFLSVTEYHDASRRLTRVRLILRVRRGLGWNLLLWFVVTAILMASGLHSLLVLGAAAIIFIMLFIPIWLGMMRLGMKKIARNAAKAAGMVEMR
ncbi:MAG: glycosyltransferase [Verrucomicrobiaceae bacterium]